MRKTISAAILATMVYGAAMPQDIGTAPGRAPVPQTIEIAGTLTPGSIFLAAQGKKIGGINRSRLKWRGSISSNIDVYRDGIVIATVPNSGRYTDSTGTTGQASFMYQVCEAGTQTCSNTVTVNFGPSVKLQ